MDGLPVIIRLLDPPLHEFVPESPEKRQALAKSLGIDMEELKKRADALHESNPMMGHRGVRLGITYPEVTEMQFRAILEAAAELIKEGKKPYPEIMIPVVCDVNEIRNQKEIVDAGLRGELHEVRPQEDQAHGRHHDRDPARGAAGRPDRRGRRVLQLRHQRPDPDDLRLQPRRHRRLPARLRQQKILPGDPFQTIDQDGVGQLIKIGIERGRKTQQESRRSASAASTAASRVSVNFCHKVGMDYVSCSPFRVPIARLAAAQAAVAKK